MRSMMGELMPVQQVTDDLRRFSGVLKKELYSIGRELLAEVETEITPERARDLDERITKRLEAALRQLSAGEFRYDGE